MNAKASFGAKFAIYLIMNIKLIHLFGSEAINTTYSSSRGHKLFSREHDKISLSGFVLKWAQSGAIPLKSAVCLVKLFLESTAVYSLKISILELNHSIFIF